MQRRGLVGGEKRPLLGGKPEAISTVGLQREERQEGVVQIGGAGSFIPSLNCRRKQRYLPRVAARRCSVQQVSSAALQVVRGDLARCSTRPVREVRAGTSRCSAEQRASGGHSLRGWRSWCGARRERAAAAIARSAWFLQGLA